MWGLAVVVALYFYVRLAMWVVKKLADKRESKRWKWGVRVGVTLVFVLVPTWDSILGHIYLDHLCTTEAGVKVYKTVELPVEYWDEQGRPKFYKENGDLDHEKLGNRFAEPHVIEPYPSFFRIDRMRMQLVENYNHDVLGEVIDFMYWGGWVSRNLSPHNTAVGCEYFNGNKFWHDFYMRFFKPATSTR